MPDWLRDLFNSRDDTQRSLQRAYEQLRSDLIKTRKQLASSIANERKLEKRLTDNKVTPEITARIETELILLKTETQRLKQLMETVESKVQTAYTEKQIHIARSKAQRNDPTKPIVVIIAIITAWALVGVLLHFKAQW